MKRRPNAFHTFVHALVRTCGRASAQRCVADAVVHRVPRGVSKAVALWQPRGGRPPRGRAACGSGSRTQRCEGVRCAAAERVCAAASNAADAAAGHGHRGRWQLAVGRGWRWWRRGGRGVHAAGARTRLCASLRAACGRVGAGGCRRHETVRGGVECGCEGEGWEGGGIVCARRRRGGGGRGCECRGAEGVLRRLRCLIECGR
eukprot:26181-Chlamydomonas_euryale.AAC.1